MGGGDVMNKDEEIVIAQLKYAKQEADYYALSVRQWASS